MREARRAEEAALEKVKPGKELVRRIREAAEALVERSAAVATELGATYKPMVVGSVAKGTFLATKTEIDVFLLFPPDVARERLESLGLEAGRRVLESHELRYAEHPYVHGAFRGFEADVVPAYEIASPEQRVSAVDRTPFHTEYVRRRLKKRHVDDVLLLKQFLRGIGVYGAETAVGGFSGYLAELLVLRFGGFHAALEAARGWKRGTVVALEPAEHPLFDAPLVVVDPVDAKRNAAAGVTPPSLRRLQEAAGEYLAKPRATFFFPRDAAPLPAEELVRRMEQKGTTFVGVELPRPALREDALLPHLRKASRNLATHLGLEGFVVVEPHVVLGRDPGAPAILLLELERASLPDTRVHDGPPETLDTRVREFREKWEASPLAVGKPFAKGGRWHVRVQREETRAEAILAKHLPEWHLGKYADEAVQQGARVLGPRELAGSAAREALTELVTGVRPWER